MVAIVAVAQAIAGTGGGTGLIITGLIGAFIGRGVWAAVTYLIGDKLLGGTATWGELLRTLGFAQPPRTPDRLSRVASRRVDSVCRRNLGPGRGIRWTASGVGYRESEDPLYGRAWMAGLGHGHRDSNGTLGWHWGALGS